MRPPLAPLALFAAAVLAGCGALDPFPTVPREVQPGQPAGQRVAICYNTLTTALTEVAVQAQQECGATAPNTIARPVDTDWYMQTCPLLLPARATFACAAKK